MDAQAATLVIVGGHGFVVFIVVVCFDTERYKNRGGLRFYTYILNLDG